MPRFSSRPVSRSRRRARLRALHAVADPVAAARATGLRYVTSTQPGIARRRIGRGFCYLAGRRLVRDAATLRRVRGLVIPPAWTHVWICTHPDGHLQATGRDARGRKQYRYHPRWRAVRDETKFGRMIAFAEALPRIRRQIEHDLALAGLPREKVLATVVRLLERTHLRVGNEEYARANGSFGLTTLRNRHVRVNGRHLRLRFRAKGGKRLIVDLADPCLARIVARCRDLPGQELFQYRGDDGRPHPIGSADVNAYLRTATGDDFTAKDFRTWAGTVLTAVALDAAPVFKTATEAKRNVVRAIKGTADRLANTPAICRKCYVHPAVIDAYAAGKTLYAFRSDNPRDGLNDTEAATLALLQKVAEPQRAAS
ncbi:MAG TPA: DNA topoisomerase IB [Candidatus Binatia bacterium]|nr:DNA topoisomerase IB [Candidatus Binatia bacterium]